MLKKQVELPIFIENTCKKLCKKNFKKLRQKIYCKNLKFLFTKRLRQMNA